MDEQLAKQLKEAEMAVKDAERRLGPDHPELADRLQKYAILLREAGGHALDAVNIEARAKAIRAKLYAADERAHGTTTTTQGKQVVRQEATVGMYVGIAGVFVALLSLFVNQEYLILILPLALIMAGADVFMSRGGFWRAGLIVLFALSAWYSNLSLPGNMLIDSSPIDRFNYASEHADIVASAKDLEKATPVLGYSICLPAGFTASGDDTKDWGRVLSWQGPPRSENRLPPQFRIMLVRLPEDLQKRGANISVLKAARDIAMPQVSDSLNLDDSTSEPPEMAEINGFEFAKISFKGTSGVGDSNGFAYVAVAGKDLLVIAASDLSQFAQDTLSALDASVYTFTKSRQSGEKSI